MNARDGCKCVGYKDYDKSIPKFCLRQEDSEGMFAIQVPVVSSATVQRSVFSRPTLGLSTLPSAYVGNGFVQNVTGLRKCVATQDMSDMLQTCHMTFSNVARHLRKSTLINVATMSSKRHVFEMSSKCLPSF